MHAFFKVTALAVLLCTQHAKAQTSMPPADKMIYLFFSDPSILSHVDGQGKPVFYGFVINNIVNQYNVTGFEQSYPTSRFQLMRRVYKMNVSDTLLPRTLVNNFPQFFSGWELVPPVQSMPFFIPNDYPNVVGKRNTGYLDSIGAPKAWDYSKGDSNIVIGIHDWDLDPLHPDLANKLDTFQNIIYPIGAATNGHGTKTAGLIASETENNPGPPPGTPPYGYYPSIGFKCKLDYVGCVYPPFTPLPPTIEDKCPGFLQTSQRRSRIMNLSGGTWGGDTLFNIYPTAPNLRIAMENMYQEIYENGTFFVAAAGNGYNQTASWPSHWYNYPSSLDYVFSVSGVGWKNPYFGGVHTNVSGLHEQLRSDSMTSQTHNSRVDLLAPSFDIGGLELLNDYSLGTGSKGTSLAAPLVAGTAGLILALDSCYTPYQLEYILKQSAKTSILSLPQNVKYAGKLGAGALDAGKALENTWNGMNNPVAVPQYNCNYSGTQTLFIEGVEFNTLCVPGRSSNGAKPKITPIIRNGIPPYKARWERMDHSTNLATIVSDTAFTAEISSAIEYGVGGSKFVYRLTIIDNSPIPKTASRIIVLQLTSGESETSSRPYLVGRDAYMDMVFGENKMDTLDRRDDNFYMSPDLWNRQTSVYNSNHQNAEYKIHDSNYAFTRIRNVGCTRYEASDYPHYVKMYWTVASTGENWQNDWDGSGTIGSQPSGGMITTGNGILIKSLDPGDTMIIQKGWKPVNPLDYGSSKLNVCLLSRIVAANGVCCTEVTGPIITNVRKNNRVFTRNLWVDDLHKGNKTSITRVLVANADDADRTFDVQFINDKAIHLHFAGNFSAIGYVKLHLGALYDVWLGAGGEGSYLERNDEEQWVMTDGSQTLELLNLPLEANAKYPVDVEFSLYDGVAIPEYRFDFHLRQFAHDADGMRIPDVYGSMSFQINTSSEGEDDGPGIGNKAFPQTTEETTNNSFSIYPNPVKNNLTVSYLGDEEKLVTINIFDMMGRKLQTKTDQYFQNSYIEMDVSDFVPGVYFISITNDKGVSERFKFVKE